MAATGALKQIQRQRVARVKEAQAHYWQALEHQERLIQELDQAVTEEVDGSFAVALELRATAFALNELVRRQEVLVNLVLRPEILPPDQDEKQAL